MLPFRLNALKPWMRLCRNCTIFKLVSFCSIKIHERMVVLHSSVVSWEGTHNDCYFPSNNHIIHDATMILLFFVHVDCHIISY